jgi:YD repeat-containing protein
MVHGLPPPAKVVETHPTQSAILPGSGQPFILLYYGYDAADRLTSEDWYDAGMSSLYAFQWDYDPVGNRTYENRDGKETYYTYDAGSELLHTVSDGASTYFHYDARGNCTAIQEPDGTTYFAYAGANLVRSIAYKTGVANYFYYEAGLRRYAIEESTGLRYFTWDENGMNLLCERDAEGATVAEYTHGETPISGIGSMTAAKKADGGATEYQYPVYDHRGTVMRLTDAEGRVSATYEYRCVCQVVSGRRGFSFLSFTNRS